MGALPTGAVATYEAIGNREDLSDVIYRIDPTDTPFLSGIERETATATKHEWQTQALASASTSNAQLEGDDAVGDAATVTVRRNNYCQISRKVPVVTGTQQAVLHAGRDDELAYQEMLKGLELKRDMEAILTSNQAQNAGSDAAARKTGSVLSWIKTNTVKGSSGCDPSSADGNDIRADGTQVAFTEANLKTVLSSVWTQGGKPDVIMLGAFNKQVMSGFTGRGTPVEQTATRKIVAAVDTYESDFGTMKVVPNRFMRSRDVYVLQMDMWAVAYLKGRRMVSIPLSITGDSVRRELISEYALVARNEKSSGGVFDNTTS